MIDFRFDKSDTLFFKDLSSITGNNENEHFVRFESYFVSVDGELVLDEVRCFPFIRLSKALCFTARRVDTINRRMVSFRPEKHIRLSVFRVGCTFPLFTLLDVIITLD